MVYFRLNVILFLGNYVELRMSSGGLEEHAGC